MGKLEPFHLGSTPFHTSVGRTFEEANHAGCGKAHQIIHGENERTFNQAVDHQSVLVWINLRQPGMVALKYNRTGRNDARNISQRGKTDGRDSVGGQPVDGSAFNTGFKPGWLPIGICHHARTQCF